MMDKNNSNIEKSRDSQSKLYLLPIIDNPNDINQENATTISEVVDASLSALQSKHDLVKEQIGILDERSARLLDLKYKGLPDKIDELSNGLFEVFESAVTEQTDTGQVSQATMDKIKSSYQILKSALEEAEKINMDSVLDKTLQDNQGESYEEHYLNKVEAGVLSGREDIAGCRATLEMINSSIYRDFFPDDFKIKMEDFGKKINIVEKWLNQLADKSDEIKTKFTQNKLSDDEVQRLALDLDKFRQQILQNISSLEKEALRIQKEALERKKEQDKLVDRLNKLSKRLSDRLSVGIYSGDATKTSVEKLLTKIDLMKNKSLNQAMVDMLEKEAENNIFIPESRSDEKAEKMKLQYYWKPRLINENKKILKMVEEFEKTQGILHKSSPPIQKILGAVGLRFSALMGRYDLALKAIDNINTASEESLENINQALADYQNELSEAEKIYQASGPKLAQIEQITLQPKIDYLLSDLNKSVVTNDQRDMLGAWQRLIKGGLADTLEEMHQLAETLDKITAQVDKNRQTQQVEVKPAFVAKEEKVEAVKTFKLEKITKKDLVKGVKEMLANEGVIDLSAKDIVSSLNPAEINQLLAQVKNDLTEKNDANRDAFQRSLRLVLKENILSDIEAEKREEMCERVAEQAYSLLKGAVEAESQKELAKLQSKHASKLALAGKTGAKIMANIGLYGGIGIGAGMIIGSGGAAAAVAGASIALARLANKAVANSDIWQSAKQKASSLWEKTGGKLFHKEKSPVDPDKVINSISEKILNPNIIATIIANQLRENSSQQLLSAVSEYQKDKMEVLHSPNSQTELKFQQSLDEVSREFYKKSYAYLEMKYHNQAISQEMLAKMALAMTLNLQMYQRGEVKMSEVLNSQMVLDKIPEDKHWLVNKMERFLKIRSEGIGSVMFGGAMAYAVAESSMVGRTVSGALSGAGLGLMLEKRFRKSDQEKLVMLIDKIIADTEKKLFSREMEILPGDLNKAKKDADYIKAQLEAGALSDNLLLKNRAENFIVRVNKEMMKSYEAPTFSIDNLLSEVRESTKRQEKETAKVLKQLMKISQTKDRQLAYMAVGSAVGAVAGYLGTNLANYLRTSATDQIVLSDEFATPKDLALAFSITPLEKSAGLSTSVSDYYSPSALDQTIAGERLITPPTGYVREAGLDDIIISEDITAEPVVKPSSVYRPKLSVEPKPDMVGAEPEKIDNTALQIREIFAQAEKDLAQAEKTPSITTETIQSTPESIRLISQPDHIQIVSANTGEPLSVTKIYRASIYNLGNQEEMYFTRNEERLINETIQKGEVDRAAAMIEEYKSRGPIYEDIKTGRQYHTDELSFVSDQSGDISTLASIETKTSLSDLSAQTQDVKTNQIVGQDIIRRFPKVELPENPYIEKPSIEKPTMKLDSWEDITSNTGPAKQRHIDSLEEVGWAKEVDVVDKVEKIPKVELPENPYLETMSPVEKNEFEKIIASIPENRMTEEQYNKMIDIYNQRGRQFAERYVSLINQGKLRQASALEVLAEKISGQYELPPEMAIPSVDNRSINLSSVIDQSSSTPTASEPEKIMATEPTVAEGFSDDEIANEAKRIVAEAEARLKSASNKESGLTEEEEMNMEDEEEITDKMIEDRAKEITAQAERNLAHSLRSKRAVEAYDWLIDSERNVKLTGYEKEILADLKKDFVDQMLDNKKIKPELLQRINSFKSVVELDFL